MMPRLKLVLPLLILGLGAVSVYGFYATRPKPEQTSSSASAPLVRVQRVELRPLDFVVRAHGTVAPRREGDLIPEVSGPVVWVSPVLASGGFFEESEPLVRIDRADYEVALESAGAVVARVESEHERAVVERERQQRLADRAVASETHVDDAHNAARVAAATLREARAKLERAKRDLERTELRAPYAGRVRQANVDVGQFVNRGSAIGKIYAVDYAEVRLPVPDAELDFLELPLMFRGDTQADGPEVRLRARFAGHEHVWRGRVVRTEGEIDPRTRMVHVVVRVEDPYGRARVRNEADAAQVRPPLAVGLFVEAEILGRHVEAAIDLPRGALRTDGRVLVVDDQQRMYTREVDVLRVEGERVVIGGGLAPGERVVVWPMQAVVEGMVVRVHAVSGQTRADFEQSPRPDGGAEPGRDGAGGAS